MPADPLLDAVEPDLDDQPLDQDGCLLPDYSDQWWHIDHPEPEL